MLIAMDRGVLQEWLRDVASKMPPAGNVHQGGTMQYRQERPYRKKQVSPSASPKVPSPKARTLSVGI